MLYNFICNGIGIYIVDLYQNDKSQGDVIDEEDLLFKRSDFNNQFFAVLKYTNVKRNDAT